MNRYVFAATIALTLLSCGAAGAADISGVWASNLTVCDKVFVKRGGTVQFTQSADMYGSGFIIEGDKIRGKIATCNIKARKEDGDVVHLVATCGTSVALSENQFSLKIVDQNRISRLFPGMPELKTDYFRCQM